MIRENRVYGLYIQKIFCMVYDKRKQSVWFIYIANILYGLQIEKIYCMVYRQRKTHDCKKKEM